MSAQLIVQILHMVQAAFNFLTSRGLAKDRIQALLDAAEGGDLTTDQVQAELDALDSELDETGDMIGGDPE